MQEEHWQAIVNCDASYDGQFFYAVTTTGIFCRPSCKSRAPKRTNVEIFPNRESALAANFRACKRCRPDHLIGPDEDLAHRVLQVIAQRYSEPLTLTALAEELHVSSYHLHHIFKRVTGKTPAESVLETRLTVAKRLLSETDQSITDIAGTVGFSNMAYFSTVFQKHIGMSPSVYRSHARDSRPF